MVVQKTDLQSAVPSSTAYTAFANGDIVDANTTNANNAAWLNLVTLLFNYCIDQTPQTGVATTYTAAQSYVAGIITDLITSYTTNGNIVLSNGTGKVYKNSVASGNQYLTNTEIVALINSASGAVTMTGSTSGSAGTSGLTPANAAGTNWKVLRGDATWGNSLPLNTTVQTSGFTVTIGQVYMVNSTSAAFTVTFPSSASQGDRFGIIDIGGSCSTNNITFGRNGLKIMNLTEDMTFNINYGRAYFEYDTSRGWTLC